VFGRRAYETDDTSRNNLLVALATGGEGWHNNHHRYPWSARQGFRWWQIDTTYYVLRALSWVGIVRDLRPVPATVIEEARDARARRRASGTSP
jgi:stearoyl-CoA desaturase (Delta-9 desaturase)